MKSRLAVSAIAVAISAASAAAGPIAADSAGGAKPPFEARDIAAAERLIGLEFSAAERDSMLRDLMENLDSYLAIRAIELENSSAPALRFDPFPAGSVFAAAENRFSPGPARTLERRGDLEDLAFASVRDLAGLIRARKITSVELTEMCLGRLRRHAPALECVVTLTEERALAAARRADDELARGTYRGLLHGIPYGAKDLLAAKGYPTTWGAAPYRERIIDEDAAVIRKLEEAGAVLVAKFSLGALAWGDVWFGGTTRNPWDPAQGSSGSSAGSAAATAAGLVPFAIGTETWGSIVSPSTRCGATGLRPTYGRVSRAGAMALSWSMDKIGPICRSVEDCAIVFDAIRGPDGADETVIDAPFDYEARRDLAGRRIGYLKSAFDGEYDGRRNDLATLEKLRDLGAELVAVELPDYPVYPLAFILSAEAAAAFDELTRSGRDSLLVRQTRDAWPNVFRASRFIPAVEYINANRVRRLIMRDMEALGVDVWVSPAFEGTNLLLTNLTGHPCVVLPNGWDETGHPTSITFMGKLFGEGALLEAAAAYQNATGFHLKHPPLFR